MSDESKEAMMGTFGEENPLSIFDPDLVRGTAMRQLQEMEDRHNFNRRVWFLRAVENWKLNKRVGSPALRPLPQPPLAVHYQWVENITPNAEGKIDNDPIMTEGPDLVAEPYLPPERPDPLVEGFVDFGVPIEDGSGRFQMGVKNTVPVSTHAHKDGKEYILVALKGPGFLYKFWQPTGSEL